MPGSILTAAGRSLVAATGTPVRFAYLAKHRLRVAYTELGDVASKDVVFYLHGFPSCRLEGLILDRAAHANGLKLIAVDRPGYGQTPFTWRHSFRFWGGCIPELADTLGVRKFAVMGTSGGPAFVAACGLPGKMTSPERLACLCLVAPEGPSAGLGLRVPESIEPAVMFTASLLARLVNLALMPFWYSGWVFFAYAPGSWVVNITKPLSWLITADPRRSDTCKAVVSNQEHLLQHGFRAAAAEGLRQGLLGTLYEGFQMYVLDWKFALRDVRCNKVLMYHGKADVDVRESSAKCYKDIKGCQATYFDNEGHVSILPNQGDRICRDIKAVFENNT